MCPDYSSELWEYIVMNVFIHPLLHILHHFLKRKDYDEFIKEIRISKKYFMEYSKNNVNIYFFGNLFENKDEMNERFIELRDLIKNKDNEIEEIIRINIR
jgi:hypothetical protein